MNPFLPAAFSCEAEIVVGAVLGVNPRIGRNRGGMNLPIAKPSETSLEDVGDADEDCLLSIDASAACIWVMDRSTSGRWLIASELLAFRRFGVGPDIADGDTCLERLRGVKVAEVRNDVFCDGLENPVLLESGASLSC